MSRGGASSAPFAVGGNLAEGFDDLSLDDKRRRARQGARAESGAKSTSEALLDDKAVIKARFPDKQDAKKQFTTVASEMSRAIPKARELTLYDDPQHSKMERLAALPARREADLEHVIERREKIAAAGVRGPKSAALSRLMGEEGIGRPGSGSRSNSPAPGSGRNSPAPGRYGSPGPGSRSASPAPGPGSARYGSPAPNSGRSSPAPARYGSPAPR